MFIVWFLCKELGTDFCHGKESIIFFLSLLDVYKKGVLKKKTNFTFIQIHYCIVCAGSDSIQRLNQTEHEITRKKLKIKNFNHLMLKLIFYTVSF